VTPMTPEAFESLVTGRCLWCKEKVVGQLAAGQHREVSLVIVTSGRRTHCLRSARPVPLALKKEDAPSVTPTTEESMESVAA
jgi:hypothetical protein